MVGIFFANLMILDDLLDVQQVLVSGVQIVQVIWQVLVLRQLQLNVGHHLCAFLDTGHHHLHALHSTKE